MTKTLSTIAYCAIGEKSELGEYEYNGQKCGIMKEKKSKKKDALQKMIDEWKGVPGKKPNRIMLGISVKGEIIKALK